MAVFNYTCSPGEKIPLNFLGLRFDSHCIYQVRGR